jgi:hypothetical protein
MDPIRDLVDELIASSAVSTDRIRRGEPASGDSQGPGAYQKFVVLVPLPSTRNPRLPVERITVIARCYAATYSAARILASEVAREVNNRGPRIGLALIYRSFAPSLGGEERDPDTGQPQVNVTLTLHAATVAVS